MILPIGIGCMTADTIKRLGYRECSYPFDWAVTNPQIVLRILRIVLSKDTDMEKFADDFFDRSKNNSYIQNFDNREVFVNVEYDVSFPHHDIDTIREKLGRRFLRLREHFYTDDVVFIMFTSRWDYYDEDLYELYDFLSSLRNNVYMFCVNGMGKPVKTKYEGLIHNYLLKYDENERQKSNEPNYDWKYDKNVWSKILDAKYAQMFTVVEKLTP